MKRSAGDEDDPGQKRLVRRQEGQAQGSAAPLRKVSPQVPSSVPLHLEQNLLNVRDLCRVTIWTGTLEYQNGPHSNDQRQDVDIISGKIHSNMRINTDNWPKQLKMTTISHHDYKKVSSLGLSTPICSCIFSVDGDCDKKSYGAFIQYACSTHMVCVALLEYTSSVIQVLRLSTLIVEGEMIPVTFIEKYSNNDHTVKLLTDLGILSHATTYNKTSMAKKEREMDKMMKQITEQRRALLQKDEALKEKEVELLTQRNRALSVKEEELIERDRAQLEKEEELKEKDRALSKKQEELTQRDRALLVKEEELIERDRAQLEKEEELIEKDRALSKKEEELTHRDRALSVIEGELRERDRAQSDKEEEFIARDKALSERETDYIEKNKVLSQKQSDLVVKDITLMEKEDTLLEKERAQSVLKEENNKLKHKNDKLEEELQILQRASSHAQHLDGAKRKTVTQPNIEEDVDGILQREATRLELVNDVETKKAALDDIEDMMENEFKCSICAQPFIKTTTLNCSHSFCEFCIKKWLDGKRTCPNCRLMTTSSVHSVVIDNCIEKIVSKLGDEAKQRRKETVREREETITVERYGQPVVIQDDDDSDDQSSTVTSPSSSSTNLRSPASMMSSYYPSPASTLSSTWWRSPSSIANMFSPRSVSSTNTASPAAT